MAGFYELATGLQAPILGILRAKQPIVSGGHLKNSRFWEMAAGPRGNRPSTPALTRSGARKASEIVMLT
jgi:hypothetical protein